MKTKRKRFQKIRATNVSLLSRLKKRSLRLSLRISDKLIENLAISFSLLLTPFSLSLSFFHASVLQR